MKLGIVLLCCCIGVAVGQYDYSEAIAKSLLFYEAQRTGQLPASNRISWRGNTFLNDQGSSGEDLSGGYFDAGDFVKFGFPFSGAMTMLAWGMAEFKEGYVKANQWDYAKEALKWGLDWMIKAHPEPNVLYVQVGDAARDHSYWGRPEDWPTTDVRPNLRATTALPATEVAAEQAAAMAAGAEVFLADGDASYAAILLQHARDCYSFANNSRAKYSDSFPIVRDYYQSWSGYGDELFWGAAWLYRVTGEALYQEEYERHWTEFGMNSRPTEASWDLKQAQGQALLAKTDGSAKYMDAAQAFCDWVVDTAPKTPKGLVFLSEWGSLRHAANAMMVCLQAAEAGINPDKYRTFAKTQLDYMLGSSGRSFMCGFGENPPVRPHHAAASCNPAPATCDWADFSKPDPNPNVLTGALVGGPNINDVYEDRREDYVANEVTLDYNAGFQSALAGLCILHC